MKQIHDNSRQLDVIHLLHSSNYNPIILACESLTIESYSLTC